MTKSTKIVIGLAVGSVVLLTLILGAGYALLRFGLQSLLAYYPEAGPMPPVVSESMDEALARFEAALAKHAPLSLEHLQPALSAERIAELEQEGGFQLTDEMRALYRWRNGVPPKDLTEIIPLHNFRSLEEAAERHKEVSKSSNDPIIGHMAVWVPVFGNPFGDGYFCDPTRSPEQGAVFECSIELGSFRFYPSLRNLLVGLAECYETGAFTMDAQGQLNDDYDKTSEILRKYGVDR